MNTCKRCGKETTNKTFCDNECRRVTKPRYTNTCVFCKKEYGSRVKTQQYCTRECYNNYLQLTRTVRLKCDHCSELFRVSVTRANITKYCSAYCKQAALQERKDKLEYLTEKQKAVRKREELESIERKRNKKVCATCRSCQRATMPFGDKNCFTCTDQGSPYHKALLNINEHGIAGRYVTWGGCNSWKIDRSKKRVRGRTDPTLYHEYVKRLEKILEKEKENDTREAHRNIPKLL